MKIPAKIPHFSSIIRWTLRNGLHLLTNQNVSLNTDWVCVLDHTIRIGIKKALVILKIPLDAMKKEVALGHNDVQIIHIEVGIKSNGDIVEKILRKLFFKIGFPKQIISDHGSDLKKGIKNIIEKLKIPLKSTYDLTHFISNLLKKKYSTDSQFLEIKKKIYQIRAEILQTSLAFLLPPKERVKARFLNLPEYAKWFEKIISYLTTSYAQSKDQQKATELFSWLLDHLEWVQNFIFEMKTLNEMQKILKNHGMSVKIAEKLSIILCNFDDTYILDKVTNYLQEELDFSEKVGYPTLITSDVLESLFGKYKEVIKPHCGSEINRSILSMPCITSKIELDAIKDAFKNVKNKDVEEWSKKNIGETVHSKKIKEFTSSEKQISSKNKSAQNGPESAEGPCVIPYAESL